jgi:uncharacterized protein
MSTRVVEYFSNPGPENTGRCIELVQGLVDEGLSHVVVATTEGDTGLALAKALQGKKATLVAVTHNVGFDRPNENSCSDAVRRQIESLGAKVFTGTILTRNIETALMRKHQGVYPTYIVAETLRLFGQGTKVGVEITMAACDAGLLPESRDVVAVAGTGRGADTVLIIEAHSSNRFLDLKVKQVVAKPG